MSRERRKLTYSHITPTEEIGLRQSYTLTGTRITAESQKSLPFQRRIISFIQSQHQQLDKLFWIQILTEYYLPRKVSQQDNACFCGVILFIRILKSSETNQLDLTSRAYPTCTIITRRIRPVGPFRLMIS